MFITAFTKPPTYPYCESHQYTPNYHFLKININVIFPSTPWSSKCLFPSGSPATTLYASLLSPHLECISLNINWSKQSIIRSAWLVVWLLYFPQECHMIACILLTRPLPEVCSLYRGFKPAQNLTLMATTGRGEWVGVRLIIIFINCNWVVTRWQWLFYMYTKREIGYYWI